MKIIKTLSLIACLFFISLPSVFAGDITTSDVWLDSKITTTYALNEHLNPFDISVDVKNGVAVLGGKVNSSVEKLLAVEIAKGMEGIKKVVDNIKVSPPARKEHSTGFKETVDNASTVARVKSNLLWNRKTTGMNIDVDADGGVVTLSGMVSSEVEKEMAHKLAENTSGVYRVNNKLMVDQESKDLEKSTTVGEKIDNTIKKTEEAVSDGWITARVKSRLLFDKETDGLDINVTTKNAIVMLEGSVSSEIEKGYAVKLVENTVDVKKVIDKLTIKEE